MRFQIILVNMVFTHPLGIVARSASQNILQYKAYTFLSLVDSKHIIFRDIEAPWCSGLKILVKVLCYLLVFCNHVLQIPLAWPQLVWEYQRLSPRDHCQSKLDQWPTEGYQYLTAVEWVIWQALLSGSDGHLSKAVWISFQLFWQRKAEMTGQEEEKLHHSIDRVSFMSFRGGIPS